MQKHRDLTLRRLAQFASDSGLRGKLYPEKAPVRLAVFHAPGRIPYNEAVQGTFQPLKLGEAMLRLGINTPFNKPVIPANTID